MNLLCGSLATPQSTILPKAKRIMEEIYYKNVRITHCHTRPEFGAFTEDLENINLCNSDGESFRKHHRDVAAAKAYIDIHAPF